MIIGRHVVDPVFVLGGSVEFNPETKCYHVEIELSDSMLGQDVEKSADADKLLRLIDKAVSDGAIVRRECMTPAAEEHDDGNA